MSEALDPLTGHVLRTEDCGSSQTHLPLTEPILLPAAEELPAPAMNGRGVRGIENQRPSTSEVRKEDVIMQEEQTCTVGFQTLQNLKTPEELVT